MQLRDREILTCTAAVVLISIKSGASGTSTLSNLKKTSKSMTKICRTTCICLTLSNKTASVLRRVTSTRGPANTTKSSKKPSSLQILKCKPLNLTSSIGRFWTIALCNKQLRYVAAVPRSLIMKLRSS